MATGQSLLDRMELLDQELQLQTGEADVVRGLLSLNVAQDYLETMLSKHPNAKGGTAGTVTTTAATETTAYPTGLLRVDRLQYIDTVSTPNLPVYDLTPRKRVGSHRFSRYWPWSLVAPSGTGAPRSYYTNARLIYWDPLPDATYTVRWYGLQQATDITAVGTFLYDDTAMLPLAALAVAILSRGVGDDAQDITSLASSILGPVVEELAGHDRDGGAQFEYSRIHTT